MSGLPADIREVAADQVDAVADLVAGLSDAELVAPTRCAGWLAAHLLVHVRLGLAGATGSFADPAGPDEPTDRDFVSYWRDWPAAAEPVTFGGVRWHWANASAYSVASEFRRHFADTAGAAAGISRRAPTGRFRIQGHVMDAEDILAMWTVELVVHQLDLIAYLPGRQGPLPAALELTTLTLDGLLAGARRPPSWDDATYVLKATGRIELDAADREALGERAAAFPAFG
jgi:mycothiol maleylpyruvate isomerase-like protein